MDWPPAKSRNYFLSASGFNFYRATSSTKLSKFPFPFNPRTSRPRPPSRHRRKVECTTPQRENGPARSCRCRCRKCFRVLVFLQIIFTALTPSCCPSFASSSAPSCSSSCLCTRAPFFACPSTQVFRGVLQRSEIPHGNECATCGLSSLSCSHFLWVFMDLSAGKNIG